jgi:prolyl-tRNA editing enzyme YbaK/EbsC (Cys-tRNA(Pro) deacylase)
MRTTVGVSPRKLAGESTAIKLIPVSRRKRQVVSCTEIAQTLGCKRGNVYKTLKAAGLN